MLYENKQNEPNEVFVFISQMEYEYKSNESKYINKHLAKIGLVLLEVESNISLILNQSSFLHETKSELLFIDIQHELKQKDKRKRNICRAKSHSHSKLRTSNNDKYDKAKCSSNKKRLDLTELLKPKENRKHQAESFDEWSTRFMSVLSYHLDSLINKKQNILNYNRSKSNSKQSTLTMRKKEILNQIKLLKSDQIEHIAKEILIINKTQDGKYLIDLTHYSTAMIGKLEREVLKFKEDNVKQLFTLLNNKDKNNNNDNNNDNNVHLLKLSNNPLAHPNLSPSSSSLSSSSDSDLYLDSLENRDNKSIQLSNVKDFSFKKDSKEKDMEKYKQYRDKDKDFFDNYTTCISEISHDS